MVAGAAILREVERKSLPDDCAFKAHGFLLESFSN